jgi:hypothetical protein
VPPKKVRRWKFAPEEDAQLTELVKAYGDDDWFTISCLMPGRNPRQCRERWRHYLTPTVTSRPFTAEEDSRLLQLQGELGPKWKAMVGSFEGRTDISLKNRWLFLARQHRRTEAVWVPVIVKKPIEEPTTIAVKEEVNEIPWSSEDDERTKYEESTAGDLTGDYYCLNFACWE